MPAQLFECVPNYSEGRRQDVIDAIVAPFRDRAGVHPLDFRSDRDHNRLVVSLVGEPGPLQDALLESAKAAIPLIDLRNHQGAHPRIGAVDVIPFVPLRNASMADAVALARGFGERYCRETGIPVYLYEEAALRPARRRLEEVRRGQFEALHREIELPERSPDFGEPRLHPSAGATAIGARSFLIAFNVNLATPDIGIAREIARAIRASSGGLPFVKAVGVQLEERGLAQVSISITDHEKAPLHLVLERVRTEALRRGASVLETEIYGLVPAAALIESAAHHLQAEGFDQRQVLDLRLLDILEAASDCA